jgi:membrane protein required for beta-lactamase induction
MKRLLRAMGYAALPLITIIVIVAIIQGIVYGLKSLELDTETCVMVITLIFAYTVGVFIYYDKD